MPQLQALAERVDVHDAPCLRLDGPATTRYREERIGGRAPGIRKENSGREPPQERAGTARQVSDAIVAELEERFPTFIGGAFSRPV